LRLGTQAHSAVQSTVKQDFTCSTVVVKTEKRIRVNPINFYKVDFTFKVGTDVEEFYELKPITQVDKKNGQRQLEKYIEQATENGEEVVKGTTLLEGLNGKIIRDVRYSFTSLIPDAPAENRIVDLELKTFPDDPEKAGMVYYVPFNDRDDIEFRQGQEDAAKVTVAAAVGVGVGVGVLLASPEVVVPFIPAINKLLEAK